MARNATFTRQYRFLFQRFPFPKPFSSIETYLGDLASCVADTMIGVLGLEDGTRVEGTGFGAPGVVSGELVFTTIMSGYEEALTDPSYHGQMLMFTYPLQGNYGISGDDFQSDRMWPSAMVSREYWDRPTHHRLQEPSISSCMDEGKPGICDVDTRMLTLKVREHGVMRATLAVGEKRDVQDLDVVAMARSLADIRAESAGRCDMQIALSHRGPWPSHRGDRFGHQEEHFEEPLMPRIRYDCASRSCRHLGDRGDRATGPLPLQWTW